MSNTPDDELSVQRDILSARQEFDDMQEADLLKYLRESAVRIVAAVDKLEVLANDREGQSAGSDTA